MALKAFQREGLRRDKNLADLPSPNTALNNILATPSMLGSNDSFTVDDLAPIKNIYITNITASTFSTLNGVTLSFTVVLPGPPPEIDNTSNPIVYRPLVKIKNRLDTAYFSTGEPFFYGGDGPDATYYDANDIIRETTALTYDQIYGTDIEPAMQIVKSGNNLYRTSEGAIRTTANGQLTHTYGTVDGFTWVKEYSQWDVYLNPVLNELTAEDESIRDQFWERGQFVYGSKVQTSFVSLFGGVNWQGLFKPIESGDSRFFLRTTGCTQFKFQHPLYPPYSAFRYGKVDVAWEQNNGTFTAGGTYLTNLQAWLSDPTRRWIKVVCEDNVQLQTEDVIFLDTVEGPLQPRQYTIYGLTDKDPSATPQDPTTVAGKTTFFVEATTDFNLNNVDYSAIPTKSDPSQTTTGYKGTARYFPYERRPYKTYVNSVRHKITIPLSDYTTIGNDGALESYLQINDENIYRSIMIEDYIYDYRRRTTDTVEDEANPGTFVPVHTVRRYKITACNDTTQQLTLELDSTYQAVQDSSNNDQWAYVDQLSKLLKYSGTSAERITEVKNTGYIDDTNIDTGNDLFAQGTPNSPTDTLYYVARFGSATPRYKYIQIEQFLEGYTDYAIDWIYFSKDEDMEGGSVQKAWVLWYRSETGADYGPLDFKYLYDKNYKFYEIGDFKRFLDNSVLGSGTSREDGIDQRAFGKPKLITKGDQYNMMFSLLPVKSEYDPPVNWNEVAKSITGTIPEGSRAVDISDASIIEEGNYIIDNSSATAWTQGTNEFGYRSRINTKLWGTNTIITSVKATASVTNRNIYALDHKGFITTLEITGGSGNSYNYTGDASEVKIGHVIVSPEFASQSTYVRIVKIDHNSGSNSGTFILDTSVNFNGNNKLVVVYYDRGIDITKPLAAFCTDSGCGQHAYSGEKTNTEFIAIKATNASGANSDLDAIIASYTGTSNVQTINNGSATTTWLLESNMGDVTESNYNNNIWNNSVVTVQWDAGLNAEDNADGEGLTSMNNNTYYPMGWLKGLVRLKGKIWEGTAGNDEYEYYWIVRLGSNWQSNVDKFAVPADSEGNANGLSRNRSFNPRSYSGYAWNIQSYRLQIGSGGPGNYPQDGNISSSQDLTNAYNQANSGLNSWKTVGVDINLTGTQQAYFENLDTIAPDSPSTTYVLKAGMYIRRMTSNGTFWIFKDFNDFQDVHTVWANTSGSFNPTGSGNTGTTQGSGRAQQLVYLEPQQGPVKVLGNGINDNFRYLHYRRKQYEVVPVNVAVENATAGHIRLLNVSVTTSELVDNILTSGTNKLSVFTFANTTDNRELCCPPLDTSPPFDSSPIGLSTTSLEPDMSIGGLVNVRSINGNHPSTKMFPISLTNLANIGTCPVNKKFQIMFGGVKYDLLLANEPTQGGGSTLDKIIRPDLYP